jgi:tetratricopeptide (TPR) repeat protein
MRLKNIYFFFLIILYFSQCVHSQQNRSEINLADKYFEGKEYSKAKTIYNNFILEKVNIEKNSLLKLAFIYEKENDFVRSLYYLNLYFNKNPSEKVLVKMNEIASNNNLEGYELSDFYLILLLFKQYSFYIYLILVSVGLYVTIIFIIKKFKNQNIERKQKFVLLFYLIGLLGILNLPKIYKQGIVHENSANLRIDPSAASPVFQKIKEGTRLNIIGSEDVWLRVLQSNKIYYINKANVWVIE